MYQETLRRLLERQHERKKEITFSALWLGATILWTFGIFLALGLGSVFPLALSVLALLGVLLGHLYLRQKWEDIELAKLIAQPTEPKEQPQPEERLLPEIPAVPEEVQVIVSYQE